LARLLPFADVNAVDETDGTTPLIKVCSRSFDAARMLLDAGATQSINVLDSSGRTALFHACAAGIPSSYRIVELLINRGADVLFAVPDTGKSCKGFRPGWTPLFAALAQSVGAHTQKLEILLRAGADIHAVDQAGNGICSYLCPYVRSTMQTFLFLKDKQMNIS
jgi:ankyrin repeat protein